MNTTTQKNLEEIEEEILDFKKLPIYEDAKRLMDHYSQSKDYPEDKLARAGIYQYPNVEFVKELAKLLNYLDGLCSSPVPIVEVCAGNGKLSYHLNKRLPKGKSIIATDRENKPHYYPPFKEFPSFREFYPPFRRHTKFVKDLDYREAIETYRPNIVLASWIPPNSDIGIKILYSPGVRFFVNIGVPDGLCGSAEIYRVGKSKVIDSVTRFSTSKPLRLDPEIYPCQVEVFQKTRAGLEYLLDKKIKPVDTFEYNFLKKMLKKKNQ